MRLMTAQEYEDKFKRCWVCEGTGKAFNAIDMEWDTCLHCSGTGKSQKDRTPAPGQSDAIRTEAIAQGVDPNSDEAERMGRAMRQDMLRKAERP